MAAGARAVLRRADVELRILLAPKVGAKEHGRKSKGSTPKDTYSEGRSKGARSEFQAQRAKARSRARALGIHHRGVQSEGGAVDGGSII